MKCLLIYLNIGRVKVFKTELDLIKMKKLLFVFIFSMTFINSSVSWSENFSNNQPLWTQIDELICVGKSTLDCTNNGCEKGDSGAIWKINFPNKKIEFLTSLKHSYEIDEMFYKFYQSINASVHAIYFHGGLMDFNVDGENTSQLDSQVVRSYWVEDKVPEIQQITFECHAQ